MCTPVSRKVMRRPRVDLLEAHGLEDVKNFFIAMHPASRQGAPSRLLVVGRCACAAACAHAKRTVRPAVWQDSIAGGAKSAKECCALVGAFK